jgi:Phage integrase, N-terminal SAM-like domain
VTKLLQCLRDELVRRDYAPSTIRSYIQIVRTFHQQSGGRLERLTPAQRRRYHLYLLEERRLAIGTVVPNEYSVHVVAVAVASQRLIPSRAG